MLAYLLMLLKPFDLALAFGGASPGALGAAACPGWFAGVEPFLLEPLSFASGAFEVVACCSMYQS